MRRIHEQAKNYTVTRRKKPGAKQSISPSQSQALKEIAIGGDKTPVVTAAHDKPSSEDGSTDETVSQISILEAMSDWSKTGRGAHVEFDRHETVSLIQGRKLGRGAMGDVHETTVQGYRLAWKTITCRRKLTAHHRKEIEILKKISHHHMIQLVGTYTFRMDLGLLLYPVALCDLHTYFEDVEAYWTSKSDSEQRERLHRLQGNSSLEMSGKATSAFHQIGCLVSAIEYLHSQKIRHKDLKPSNILLSPNQIWLSDFGSATDFSLLSQSAADNERGTPRYFAPEVAAWEKNGRAADMFSLGCILLELLVLHENGTLQRIRENISSPDRAFHANLDSLDKWLPFSDNHSPQTHYLVKDVRAMLSKEPLKRPTAQELLSRLALANEMRPFNEKSLFGSCCQVEYISKEQHEKDLRSNKNENAELRATISLLRTEAIMNRHRRIDDYAGQKTIHSPVFP